MKLLLIFLATCTAAFADSQLRFRMIGGDPVSRLNFPFVVLVDWTNDTKSNHCLGSLINTRWVLSSALCFPDFNPDSIKITTSAPKGHICRVQKLYTLPNFDSNTFKNDLTLIKLDHPVDDPSFGTVEVGNLTGNEAQAIGRLDSDPQTLGLLNLSISDASRCKSVEELSDFDDTTQICAYGGRGKDMCDVDLGAPLLNTNTNELVGIYDNVMSLAYDHDHHCEEDHDHVLPFTRVSAFYNWISETIAANP